MYFEGRVSPEEGVRVETACTVPEMCTAIVIIVRELYGHLHDEKAKHFFKFALTKAFADGVPFANPDELNELTKKCTETKVEELHQPILDFLKELYKNDQAE